jgi:hypothetical protein
MEKTQPRSLPSGIGSAAPAHGFAHATTPTACRLPPPTPDRSVTKASPPMNKTIKQTTYPLGVARVNRRLMRWHDGEAEDLAGMD